MPLLNIFVSYYLLPASSHGSRCFLISMSVKWPKTMRNDEQYKTKGLGNEREPSVPVCYPGCFLGHKENQSP